MGGKKQTTFMRIQGVKKVRRCIICGKKITVENLNQLKCLDCGYRGVSKAQV